VIQRARSFFRDSDTSVALTVGIVGGFALHSLFVAVGYGFVKRTIDVETGKGANALEKRPELRKALELCRKSGATLLIAKLDRLARNVHFVSGLMESKVKFVACDLPEANQLTIHIMAAFAEHEARHRERNP
jgi:DNA invertase Pin-like site-specific DNA recombinase